MRGLFSIRQLILIVVVLPVVAVAAGTAYLGLRAMESYLERRLQEDVELVARAIQLPLRDALTRGNTDDVQRALSSAFRIGRVYGASVYDRDGLRIAAAGAGADRAPAEEVQELAKTGDRQGEYGAVGARRVYSYFMPLVTSGGEVTGLLQVTRQRREMEEQLRGMWLQAGLAILASTLLIIGVVVTGHHRVVGRPLDRLAESMGRVERGERDHRADTSVWTREIARLANGLNRMVTALVHSEEEIERKREEQLALQARLQRSERLAAIGQLAAGVAHELGTPLSVVDGHAQQALRDPALAEGPTRRWHAVRRECRRMEEIVHQLLAIERRKAPHREPVTPDRLIRGALSAARPDIQRNEVTVHLEHDEGAMETVHVDRRRLEQALANLLRNAAHASPGGEIRLGWTTDETDLTFTVDDDGPGIPPTERERVLQPFYTTKGPEEGTGLGLTLVQSVAEEHEGRLEIDRSPGGGARLVLSVPHGEEADREGRERS